MSYTTIFAIDPSKRTIEEMAELPNSHGSAPIIWDRMAVKYLNTEPYSYFSCIDKVWPLWEDEKIPLHHRVCLALTFDKFFVQKDNYKKLSTAIKQFLSDFPVPSNCVNHWPKIADMLLSKDCPAMGFYWTSMSDNPFEGEWDEDKEEYEFPDWNDYTEVYSLFEETK